MGLSCSLTARAAGLRLNQRSKDNKSSIREIMSLSEKLLQQGVKDKDEGMATASSKHRGIRQTFEEYSKPLGVSGGVTHVPGLAAGITQICNRREAQPPHNTPNASLIPWEVPDKLKTAKECKTGGHLLGHEDLLCMTDPLYPDSWDRL